MRNNIEFLNFAKGSAIFWIVIFHLLYGHLSGFWGKLIYLGGSGVHLFFLLSGFGLSLSKDVNSALDFYKKRFSKILIPYYAIVMLIYVIDYFLNLYTNNDISKFYVLFGHIFFYKMFDNSIIESYGGHLWFMSTLIQLYIFFPVIQKLQRYLQIETFILSSLLISLTYWIVIAYFNLNDSRVISSIFLNYLWEFNLGMSLAHLYKRKQLEIWQVNMKVSLAISTFAFLFMGAITIFSGKFGKTFNDIPSSIGILYFTIFLFQLLRYKTKLFGFFNFIGSISFEIYLIHMLVISLLNKFFSSFIEANLYLLIIYLPIILIASLGFSVILKKTNAKVIDFKNKP